MRIRCSGRLTRSSAMAACGDGQVMEGGTENDVGIFCLGLVAVNLVAAGRLIRPVARDAIDHGRGSQAAAAEGRDRGRPARHPARPEGGVRLAGRRRQSPLRLQLKFQSYRRRQDRSGIGQDDLPAIAERRPDAAGQAASSRPMASTCRTPSCRRANITVRVDIKDSDGRPGTTIFTLKVGPK